MNKTKQVTVTMTLETQNKAKKASKELLGKENLSAFISYLINKEIKEQSKN